MQGRGQVTRHRSLHGNMNISGYESVESEVPMQMMKGKMAYVFWGAQDLGFSMK